MNNDPAERVVFSDVCIVGSGPAGLAVARELAGSPLRVVLLDAGDRNGQATAPSPTTVGHALRTDILDREWRFGGSSRAWFGRIAAPDPIEFSDRPWLGMPGWPISYQEIQPWLRRSAQFLTVGHPEMLSAEKWRDDSTQRLLVAHPSAATGVFLWAGEKDLAKTAPQWIRRAGNIRIVVRTMATELVPDETSPRIARVRVRMKNGTRASIAARWVVLAAGGLENPRLLLASTKVWPAGVGNQHGVVGRFFMEHPRVEGAAEVALGQLSRSQVARLRLIGERNATPAGRAQLRLKFSERLQRDEELLNHSMHGYLCFRGDDGPGVQALRRARGDFARRDPRNLKKDAAEALLHSGAELGRLALEKFVWRKPDRLVLVDQMEQAPTSGSRVFVDWSRRDESGLPAVVLDWKVEDEVYRSQRRMHCLAKEVFGMAGIERFSSQLISDPSYVPQVIDMKHPMGTTRMSKRVQDGVVNEHCQVHGIKNLFVVGSSVLPIGGHANPTLTISALGLRLGCYLRSKA